MLERRRLRNKSYGILGDFQIEGGSRVRVVKTDPPGPHCVRSKIPPRLPSFDVIQLSYSPCFRDRWLSICFPRDFDYLYIQEKEKHLLVSVLCGPRYSFGSIVGPSYNLYSTNMRNSDFNRHLRGRSDSYMGRGRR